MPKGREFVIRMNRPDRDEQFEPGNDKIFEDRLALSHKVIKDIVKTIFKGVCTYVVLDTFRQVLIARNTNIEVFD